MKSELKKHFVTGLLILVPILVSWIVLLRLIQWLYGVLDFNIIPEGLSARKLVFLPDVAVWILDFLLSTADFLLALLTVIVVILFTGMVGRAWIMGKLIQGLRQMGTPGYDSAPDSLTATEIKVMALLGKGQSNKEIAAALNCSVKTVKNHLNSIFQKLGVQDRTQAVLAAQQRGWV